MRREFLPYGRHEITADDRQAVDEALRSDWITQGPLIAEFEKALGAITGARHTIAVNSGTAALDIAVAALELPPGSEAITTPLTFAATANALLYNGIRPVFADVQRHSWNLDPEQVLRQLTPQTRAIVAVDYSGQPADLEELRQIAADRGLFLIEDAAHSLGATYRERPVGTLADVTTFSFHPVKHVTTGEGGAVTTGDEGLAKKLALLRSHGIDREAQSRYGPDAGWAYDMKMLGRNYRLTDFQCALGISQLKRLEAFVSRRGVLARRYLELLPRGVEGIRPGQDRTSAWHLFPILLPQGVDRDRVFQQMRRRNIGVNVHYIPVYRHSYYQRHVPTDPAGFPVTEDIFSRLLTLPLFPNMLDSDVTDVVEALAESIAEVAR